MEVIRMPSGKDLEYQSIPATHEPLGPAEQLKEELEMLTRTLAQRRAELQAVRDEAECISRITLYLREHYRTEISQGRHAGRTLADVVIYYLSLERMYSQMNWLSLLWRIVTGRRGEGL
jgi:hypothetical protein